MVTVLKKTVYSEGHLDVYPKKQTNHKVVKTQEAFIAFFSKKQLLVKIQFRKPEISDISEW